MAIKGFMYLFQNNYKNTYMWICSITIHNLHQRDYHNSNPLFRLNQTRRNRKCTAYYYINRIFALTCLRNKTCVCNINKVTISFYTRKIAAIFVVVTQRTTLREKSYESNLNYSVRTQVQFYVSVCYWW
jgi:hypothetical protein